MTSNVCLISRTTDRRRNAKLAWRLEPPKFTQVFCPRVSLNRTNDMRKKAHDAAEAPTSAMLQRAGYFVYFAAAHRLGCSSFSTITLQQSLEDRDCVGTYKMPGAVKGPQTLYVQSYEALSEGKLCINAVKGTTRSSKAISSTNKTMARFCCISTDT